MTPELREHLERHLSWPELSHTDRTRFLTLALCGEVGEFAELLIDNPTMEKSVMYAGMRDEAADIGNYLFMLAIHTDTELFPYDSRKSPVRWNLADMTLALVASTGKLANVLKKDWRGDPEPPGWCARFGDEMRNVHTRLFALVIYLGVDLYAAMLAKLIEVEKRPSWREAHR